MPEWSDHEKMLTLAERSTGDLTATERMEVICDVKDLCDGELVIDMLHHLHAEHQKLRAVEKNLAEIANYHWALVTSALRPRPFLNLALTHQHFIFDGFCRELRDLRPDEHYSKPRMLNGDACQGLDARHATIFLLPGFEKTSIFNNGTLFRLTRQGAECVVLVDTYPVVILE